MDLIAGLRAFRDVAELGSLTRSAAAAGMTQSVLSRQIAALETELGGRLFHRTGRGLVLTDTGRRLLPRARALLVDAAAVLEEARGEQASPAGVVDLAVVPAARPVVAPLIARLRQDYPRIRLRAHEGFSGQVHDWVASGRADVGLLNNYGRAAVRAATALVRSRMVVIARRGLPLVRPAELPVRALAGVPLAAPLRPNALLDALQAAAQRARVELNFVFEGGSEAIVRDAVATAGLATVVPLHVAVRDYGSERFDWSPLAQPAIHQTTWLVQTNAHPATPAARLVTAALRELAPQVLREP